MALARRSLRPWFQLSSPRLSVLPSTRMYMPRGHLELRHDVLVQDAPSTRRPASLLPLRKLIVTGLVNSGSPFAATFGSYLVSLAPATCFPSASQIRRTTRSSRRVTGAKRSLISACGYLTQMPSAWL